MLIPSLQLCLAHYCDIHGPTPLMVTEGLPSPCSVCFEEGASTKSDNIPRSSPGNDVSQAQNLADDMKDLSLGRNFSTSQQGQRSRRSTAASSVNSAPLDTPPESPRLKHQQPRRDSGYRRTYDDTVTKKQGPCDNCAMTLPKLQTASAPSGDPLAAMRAPTLRTRAPAERVYGTPTQLSSPARSQASSDTDYDRDLPPRRPRSRRALESNSSRNTSCSSDSTTSERTPSHIHYVDYTSTHEPLIATSFSLIRASCLRALSFETLPRAPSTATPNSSPQVNNSPSFVTTQSAGSAATGGPIFFGDALAGYTTAYIFRIPDVHARGHKRVYAFMALSTHKERLAMKSFAVLSNAFRDLANWIQQLAEAEAERAAETNQGSAIFGGGPIGDHPPPNQPVYEAQASAERSGSSFLTGGVGLSRRMGGGGSVSSLKARGLAELVGQPDFFIELHKRFVHLLFEIGVTLSS